jgi:hypothetical protein
MVVAPLATPPSTSLPQLVPPTPVVEVPVPTVATAFLEATGDLVL